MADIYQLAEGYNNAAGYVEIEGVEVAGEDIHHVSSVGTFGTARETTVIDGTVFDDGFDTWEWVIAGVSIDQYAYFSTTFLDGQRSGPVTVRTKMNDGTWVDRNATMTLPRRPSLQGFKYGGFVLSFTMGEALP